jgi:hypothetical protein
VAILTNLGSRTLAGNLDNSHVFVHQVLLPYGSNTAQCMTEGSQRFLLATKGTTACWGINEFLDEISTSPLPNLLTSDFCSSNYDRKLSANYVPPFFKQSFNKAVHGQPRVHVNYMDI